METIDTPNDHPIRHSNVEPMEPTEPMELSTFRGQPATAPGSSLAHSASRAPWDVMFASCSEWPPINLCVITYI